MNKPETGFRFIGQPMPRHEDARLLIGAGRFTDDFDFPGQSYAAMVRSPHPHARIVSIDKARALALPGVLGVFTGADCAADGLGPIGHDPLPKTRDDMKLTAPGGGEVFIGPHVLLPADKARHVGEAVAMVVAETRAQALDACTIAARTARRARADAQAFDHVDRGGFTEISREIFILVHKCCIGVARFSRQCRRHLAPVRFARFGRSRPQ